MELTLLIVLLAAAGVYALHQRRRRAAEEPAASVPPTGNDAPADIKQQHAAPAGAPDETAPRWQREVYSLVDAASGFYGSSAHPRDMLGNEDFAAAVRLLSDQDVPVDSLVSLSTGDSAILSSMALEALARRSDSAPARAIALQYIGTIATWPLYFALKFLATATPRSEPIVLTVLQRTASYLEGRMPRLFLKEFIEARIAAGEQPRAIEPGPAPAAWQID